MCVQRSSLHQQSDDLLIVRHLARIMQHVAIVRRYIGAGAKKQSHDRQAPPEAGVEDRPPPMFVIRVHQARVLRQPRLHGLHIAARSCFVNGRFRHDQ